jgi:predicted amidohydrolase YtcJ
VKILHNARFHTLDKGQPSASALALDHGEILAVGGEDLLTEFEGATREDLRGRVVLPGLTDAHLHLKHHALSLRQIDCETASLQACLSRIGERCSRAPSGEWILGHGWNQNVWGGWPTAAELDTVSPANPVFLTAKSLHAAWVNTAALKLCGIQAGTPDPEDGEIRRTADGEPDGVLLEAAQSLVASHIPEPTVGDLADAIAEAQAVLWRFGLTAVHDFDRRDCFMALQQMHGDGRLKLRVTKSIPVDLLDQAHDLGLRTGFGDDWLRIGGVKVFMDGALGPRTAAMLSAYDGEPENFGILNLDGEELFELGRKAADVGLGMAVHAIGDRANHEALKAFAHLREYERERRMPHLRHRIEHVQLLHPDDLGELGRLNVIASMQPLHATSDMVMADQYWGQRASLAYAWQSQLHAGAPLAFGSDAPVESPNPFLGMHAAVTRRRADGSPGPDGWHPLQRISVEQAVAAYTSGPAYAAYNEGRQGTLAPRKFADLIVLDEDPFDCNPTELRTLRPSATMIGGEWVFRS